MPRRRRPPDPITMTVLAATAMAASAASGGMGIAGMLGGANAVEKAGRHQHHVGQRLERIREAEGQETRRKAVARAQAMGAAAGSPIGEPSLAQIARDVDRQTALDVWGIRERTWQDRFAAANKAASLRSQAISTGLQVGSQLIGGGVNMAGIGIPGGGGGAPSSFASAAQGLFSGGGGSMGAPSSANLAAAGRFA